MDPKRIMFGLSWRCLEYNWIKMTEFGASLHNTPVAHSPVRAHSKWRPSTVKMFARGKIRHKD